MPGEQLGATYLFTEYVHPFLAEHEAAIEKFISDTHDRAKSAGLQQVQNAVELFKQRVLGIEPQRQEPPPTAKGQVGYGSYAQALLSRFDLPSVAAARPVAGDLYGLVSEALAGAARGSGKAPATGERDLIPPEVRGREERASYLLQSRDTLRNLLQAFERESENVEEDVDEDVDEDAYEQRRSGGGGARRRHGEAIGRNRSELDFDTIERDEVAGRPSSGQRRTPSGGWAPWGWGGGRREEEDRDRDRDRDREEHNEKREYERSRKGYDKARSRDNDLAY